MKSQSHSSAYKTLRRFDGLTFPMIVLAVLVTGWEAIVRLCDIPSTVLPAPSAVRL